MAGLASSLRLGNVNLKHRAVMSPMTRIRADDQHVPLGIGRPLPMRCTSTEALFFVSYGH